MATLANPQARFVGSLVKDLQFVLAHTARRGYADGVWHPLSTAWQTGLEMGDVAAIISRETGSVADRRLAIATFDSAISEHQLPSGGFGGDAAPGGLPNIPGQFTTGGALVSLGTAYLELAPELMVSQRELWATAIHRAGRWLTHEIHFYVNGNINLQGALGLYLAWRATGDRALLNAYNAAWEFTLRPGRRWPRRGLVYTTVKAAKNGAGYLTEQGSAAPGFDAHYTTLQADYTAELYAVSHSDRALRLLNLLVDQLFTRITRSSLFLHTGGGSRRSIANENEFISASLPVLAFALRPDLRKYVDKQESIAELYFRDWARTGVDEDQIIGNFAMSLLAFQPGVAP